VSNISRNFAILFVTLLLVLGQKSVSAPDKLESTHVYVDALQRTFVHAYFPAKGGWEFSNGAVQATLNCDGTIDHISVVEHLSNPFAKQHKISPVADSGLVVAMRNSSPVMRPPDSIHCPVRMLIKFVLKNKKHGPRTCEITLM
jgi:hypothetical protein